MCFEYLKILITKLSTQPEILLINLTKKKLFCVCLNFFNIVYKIFFIQIVSKPQIKVSIIIIGIIFLKHKSKTIENDLNIFCIIFKCPKNDINKKQPTRLQKLSKPQ